VSAKLITLARYRRLNPRAQGYAVYMQAELPGSELKGLKNPYPKGTPKHLLWNEGGVSACIEAQDGDD
jgi:hypothetical protein